MGLTAIDLLTPDEWPVAREFGLTCSMGSGLGGPIERGLNDPANHDTIVDEPYVRAFRRPRAPACRT